jgi:ribosome-associated protein
MLTITPSLSLDESELHETFVRSAGPGGQNVNKVATAVQLRFDVRNSPSLTDEVRQRLTTLAGKRLSTEGVLLIEARRFRTQEQNREDARNRLAALVRQASVPPKARRPTRPSKASKERRIESKQRRSQTKRLRQTAPHSDD